MAHVLFSSLFPAVRENVLSFSTTWGISSSLKDVPPCKCRHMVSKQASISTAEGFGHTLACKIDAKTWCFCVSRSNCLPRLCPSSVTEIIRRSFHVPTFGRKQTWPESLEELCSVSQQCSAWQRIRDLEFREELVPGAHPFFEKGGKNRMYTATSRW